MSQFNAPSYEIPKTSGVCASTGRELQPGEPYYAALVELPEGTPAEPVKTTESGQDKAAEALRALGLSRIDISIEAWEQGYRPDGLFSYWKSTVPQPNEKKKLFVDDAVLMNLLERLGEATEPERLAFRHVLALILMRKKLLRYDGNVTREAGIDGQKVTQTWWILTPKLDLSKGPLGKWHPDVTIEVLDPKLDEERIEQVMAQLGEILQAEL
ncbi:MAG: hypothetical protein Kow00105_10790 [Phycisphaeraceae bacterium]